MAIGDLVGNIEAIIGTLITAELSFKAASHLLYALATYRWQNDSAALQRLNDILNRCEQAEGKRNRLIHSDWYPIPKLAKVLFASNQLPAIERAFVFNKNLLHRQI